MARMSGPYRRTWFLLPNGEIDEIDMQSWEIMEANHLAHQLGARFFWRRVRQHADEMSFDWACYRTTPAPGMVTWRPKDEIEPFKTVRSPDMDAAFMLCLAMGATN